MIKNILLPLGRLWLPALLFVLTGCNDFFGNKTKLDFIVPPQNTGTDVSYVPVLPYLTGLQAPTAVIAGNDKLLYVVDSGAQALICFDEAGREQSRMTIPGIRAVTQDRTLDLLVLGAEPLEGTSRPLATIYRISMKTGAYRLGTDKIVKKISHPSYANRSINPNDYEVSFNGIAILPDNRYMVTRSGPGLDPLTQVPNDAVLLFDTRDNFQTTVSITGDGGENYNDFFKSPTAIATIPATSLFIPNLDPLDFVVSTLNPTEDTVLRVRYINVESSEFGVSYAVQLVASQKTATSRGALYEPGRFRRPRGLCFANDETNFLFVTDQDTLYQFSPGGIEGVRLRAQSTGVFNKVTFGGTGSDLFRFRGIRGVGYLNRIVYVADKGNGRICRYKLSSDFE